MKFYKFDKYRINRGAILKDGYIYDERIEKEIEVNDIYYNIVKCIFKYNKISDIIDSENVEIKNLKCCLEFLYYNDILSLKRPFSKKTIYSKSIIKLISKSIALFSIRSSILILLFYIVLRFSFYDSFVYWIILIISIIIHEMGHLISYYILSNYNKNIYINLDKFKYEIVTPSIAKFKTRLVAISGPISGTIITIIFLIIFKKDIVLVFLILHLMNFTPFFQDGKNIFGIS